MAFVVSNKEAETKIDSPLLENRSRSGL